MGIYFYFIVLNYAKRFQIVSKLILKVDSPIHCWTELSLPEAGILIYIYSSKSIQVAF